MTGSALFVGQMAYDNHHHYGTRALGGGVANGGLRTFADVSPIIGGVLPSLPISFIGHNDHSKVSALAGVGIHRGLITVPGDLRESNITLRDGVERTECGVGSLRISRAARNRMLDLIAETAEPGSWSAVTGNLWEGVSVGFFVELIDLFRQLNVRVAVDTRGQVHKALRKAHCFPNLMFPNLEELELLADELLKGKKIDPLNDEHMLSVTSSLLPFGSSVVATLGPHGAFLFHKGHAWRILADLPPEYSIASWNGCGDAFVAAMLAALNVIGPDPTTDQIVWAAEIGAIAAASNMDNTSAGRVAPELFRTIERSHVVTTQVARDGDLITPVVVDRRLLRRAA